MIIKFKKAANKKHYPAYLYGKGQVIPFVKLQIRKSQRISIAKIGELFYRLKLRKLESEFRNMLFRERSMIAIENLAKQGPTTFEKAKEQAQRVEARISGNKKVNEAAMTFKELTKLAMEQLAKQEPITLEKAREQAKRVEERISVNRKRPRTDLPPQK